MAYVFLDIGYLGPSTNFSVDDANQFSIERLGYPIFGYWPFFNSADAAELLDRNVSSRKHCSLELPFLTS